MLTLQLPVCYLWGMWPISHPFFYTAEGRSSTVQLIDTTTDAQQPGQGVWSHTNSGPSLGPVHNAALFGSSVCLPIFTMLCVCVPVSKPLEPTGAEGDFLPVLGRWLLLL